MSLNLIIWLLMSWIIFGVTSRPSLEHKVQICGSTIAATLTSLCGKEGIFNYYKPPDNIKNFHAERKGSDLRKRSSSKGIVEECCLKSCSYIELVSYCNNKDIIEDIKRLPSNGPEYSFIPARKNNSITNNNSMKKESKKSEVKPKSELCHCWPPIKQYIHKNTIPARIGTVTEYFLNKSISYVASNAVV